MVCFVHFHLDMCFAPQRRSLFPHLNFQKWSDHGVLWTFSLGNVLRAATACTFSTSQLPKVVREWCVLYMLTSKCASRHNGVQFFISRLASWLRTRRFSEPHLHLLSSYSFSSTLLSSNLSLLSASSLLCFSSVHIVGSLTSKLPSIILCLTDHQGRRPSACPHPAKCAVNEVLAPSARSGTIFLTFIWE